MNLSNPILICDKNQEFRILLRDMLTKNGYFHVLEASSSNEALDILKDKNGFFILIEAKELTSEFSKILDRQKNFIVFAQSKDSETLSLSVKHGVEHVMTYPFHSRKLLQKINSLI